MQIRDKFILLSGNRPEAGRQSRQIRVLIPLGDSRNDTPSLLLFRNHLEQESAKFFCEVWSMGQSLTTSVLAYSLYH